LPIYAEAEAIWRLIKDFSGLNSASIIFYFVVVVAVGSERLK